MSVNIQKYEEHLEYLPEKERKAAKEAIYTARNEESVAMAIIRQTNRQKPAIAQAQNGRRNLLKQY